MASQETYVSCIWREHILTPGGPLCMEEFAFTLVELLISVAVAALLLWIAATGMAAAGSALAVRWARSAFGTLVAPARTKAVERGARLLRGRPPDNAWIRADATILEKVRFRETRNVDPIGTQATVYMTGGELPT